LGFKLNPAIGADIDVIMGKTFPIEVGEIDPDSDSNIFDLNGNAIEDNALFRKTFANFNLDESSSLFTFKLESMVCSLDTVDNLLDTVKYKIMLLLGVDTSDANKIVLTSLRC